MTFLFFSYHKAGVHGCSWRHGSIGAAEKGFAAESCNSFNFDAGFFLSDHTVLIFNFLIVVCHNVITAFALK